MKWIAAPSSTPSRRFVIEVDPAVGYYLYVYEGDDCVADYLQDTLDFAQEQAEEDFGVPRDSWEPEPDG